MRTPCGWTTLSSCQDSVYSTVHAESFQPRLVDAAFLVKMRELQSHILPTINCMDSTAWDAGLRDNAAVR